MNFVNRVGRRTKSFVTATAITHVVLATSPTPSVAAAARPLPRIAGNVTAARTAPVNVVTTTNPTPSVATAASPLPRRPGSVTLGTHTFQPNVVLTINPTRSIVTPARALPLRPARIVVVDTDDHATSLVSQASPPAVTVHGRHHRRAGSATATHTAVQAGATSLPPAMSVVGAASDSPRSLPRRAGSVVAAQSPATPQGAALFRPDVIAAGQITPRAGALPTALSTTAVNASASPRQPHVTHSILTRLAALVAWTQTPKPPEVSRTPAVQPPVVSRPTPRPSAVGRHATARTPLVNGTLGLSPSDSVTVRARTAAPRSVRPTLAGTHAAPAIGQTPPTRPIVAAPTGRTNAAGRKTATRTATVPLPPTTASVSIAGRPLPQQAARIAEVASTPLVTNPPKQPTHAVVAGRATPRKAAPTAHVDTLRVAATSVQPPRPKPVAESPRIVPARPGNATRTAGTAGPAPNPVALIVRRAGAPLTHAPTPRVTLTPSVRLIGPTTSLRIAAGRPPRLAGRTRAAQAWTGSPTRHDPLPVAYRVPAGRWPRSPAKPPALASAIPAWVASNTSGQGQINGLPLDLPAAVVLWLRHYPGIASAFGETLPSSPKLFGDWNLANAQMPYLVYQEVMEGNYGFQSIDAFGQTLAFPQGQFQISVFATSKRQGRVLAEQVAAALNDAPLTFGDGVLLELRLESIHAIPEGAIGPGGSASAYHFAMTFLYRVQRNLTFTI